MKTVAGEPMFLLLLAAAGVYLAVGDLGEGLLLGFFAVVSVAAWLVLRRTMGVREGQVKIWSRDINDNP